MDEPLSNLDAKLRISMREEIIRIHREVGATTIYVTHDQTEAMTMADKIVVMNLGVVQQIASPKKTLIARTRSLESPSFSFLQEDGAWKEGKEGAKAVSELLGAENKVYRHDGRFYMAYSPGGISKEIRLTSFERIGDPIPKGRLIYECPEFAGEDIAYNAKIQPALSKRGKLIITYNVNSLNPERVKTTPIYHPHFLELTL